MTPINSHLGATAIATVRLALDGVPWAGGDAWFYLLTAKKQLTDADDIALFQVASGAGLVIAGDEATATVTAEATAGLPPTNTYADIRATHIETGVSHIIASWRWNFSRPVTRTSASSVPIYTTEPPFAGGGGAIRILRFTFEAQAAAGQIDPGRFYNVIDADLADEDGILFGDENGVPIAGIF